MVSYMMENVSRAGGIPGFQDAHPDYLGQFSNISVKYASLPCLQCNTHANQLFQLLQFLLTSWEIF
jgi:hypothetical protein